MGQTVRRSMSLEMKALLALAPVGVGLIVYTLTQGDWENVVTLAWVEVLTFMLYRTEKRDRSSSEPEHGNEA
jgi:hypothetical protein